MSYAGDVFCPFCNELVRIDGAYPPRAAGVTAVGWALVCHVQSRQDAGATDHGRRAPKRARAAPPAERMEI